MYLRVGLEWAPPEGAQTSVAQGIQVERVLRTRAGPVSQGAVLAAGTVLALDLMLHTASPLRYVVTDVPLPAGLEGINPEFVGELLPLPGHRGPFVSHQEARRDRFVVFADILPPGSSLHTVYVHATTPGRYHLPPARAEAMYAPEVYGRSSGMRVMSCAPAASWQMRPKDLPPCVDVYAHFCRWTEHNLFKTMHDRLCAM